MSALDSSSLKGWRCLFLALEAIVLGAFSFLYVVERFWGLRVEPESPIWAVVLGVIVMLAWLFLLVASPFFLKKLRWIALSGWLIAFGILLLAALTPAF
jgi:hypothetical protein